MFIRAVDFSIDGISYMGSLADENAISIENQNSPFSLEGVGFNGEAIFGTSRQHRIKTVKLRVLLKSKLYKLLQKQSNSALAGSPFLLKGVSLITSIVLDDESEEQEEIFISVAAVTSVPSTSINFSGDGKSEIVQEFELKGVA